MDSSVHLTSVGIGVSQLLPVLVLCLLAAFFIAMVRSGRQLIVETHSEYYGVPAPPPHRGGP